MQEVKLDREKQRVEIVWDDDDFETGYTFPVEFPVELLEQRKLPVGVKSRPKANGPPPGAPGGVPTGVKVKVAGTKGARGK